MSPLPASFGQGGFVLPAALPALKRRRLMVGSDGPTDSGKTEFAMSAPGPQIFICLDRGLEGALRNPNPPPTRRQDIGFKIISAPLATSMSQAEYLEYWKRFYVEYKKALENVDALSVVLDGDSDSWELQRLAEFGRLSKVPPTLYDNVNAARRAMIARAYDSGKTVIATSRVRKCYVTVYGPDGKPKMNSSGNEVREWDGTYERQGFSDQDYLWQVQLRHYRTARGEWGVELMKCKPQPGLKGFKLEGEECNFQTLVQAIFPAVPLSEWGYK